MAITLTTTARDAACNAVVDLVDIGASAAYLLVRASTTTLATINLPNPAFGNSSTGVATALGVPLSAVASASGTSDNFQVYSRGGTLLWSGTIGTSNADLIVDNTNLTATQTFTLTAWTHTQPA